MSNVSIFQRIRCTVSTNSNMVSKMWSTVIILIQFILFADERCLLRSSCLSVTAARGRLLDNVEGPLYVNDKCINCAACSSFSPSVFSRNTDGNYHVVYKQPSSEKEIEESRAALAACPVAAIRVDHIKHGKDNDESTYAYAYAHDHQNELAINAKFNGRPHPFPRLVSSNNFPNDVYYIGHHYSKSFGAFPYLVSSTTSPSESAKSMSKSWIMVDTPKYSQSAIDTIESITGSNGPSYLVLTHVDDTADHNKWKNKYPNLKRIFHSGDLGPIYNWIGDDSLEDVEILLEMKSPVVSVSDLYEKQQQRLQLFDINGNPIENDNDNDVVLVHTPGHSPGSISLLKRPKKSISNGNSEYPGVLFTGDTYSYTTRDDGHMTGFPRYGNDLRLQSKIIPLLLDLDWLIIAPGHGHVRDYTATTTTMTSTTTSTATAKHNNDVREKEMVDAIDELLHYSQN